MISEHVKFIAAAKHLGQAAQWHSEKAAELIKSL